MKPTSDHFALVTATLDPLRAAECLRSWLGRSTYHLRTYVVWGILPSAIPMTTSAQALEDAAWIKGCSRLIGDLFQPGCETIHHPSGGVVPAFALGVEAAFNEGAAAVLCLHDDVLIEQDGWDEEVIEALDRGVKFAGFGGAGTLGSAVLYQEPYNPMQLARGRFVSNMRDAEAHGRRAASIVPCVCFDGFSQLGTKDWFREAWRWLRQSGIQHHAYDGMLGCLAARAKVQPGLMLPVRCHHLGGQTAVGSEAYQQWAKRKVEGGDQTFWEQAHRVWYDEFRDVLPLRVEQFL